MTRLRFVLTVTVPDVIDDNTYTEILVNADERDITDAARIERWLGGLLGDAEWFLNDALPDGWSARIDADRREDA